MTDQLRPVPQRPDITYNWGARGSKANRLTTQYGAPVPSRSQAGFGTSFVPQETPDFPSREEVKDFNLGKTNVGEGLQAARQQTLLPEDLTPPDRKPGFFEGMMGGLVEAFSGVLGDDGVTGGIRDALVGTAELGGRVLDVPGEALGHVPINQLFGLENTEEAFKMLPMTADKQRVIDAMSLNGSARRSFSSTRGLIRWQETRPSRAVHPRWCLRYRGST